MLERSVLKGRDVALYAEGRHELDVLVPIGAELKRRGARVRTTKDFDERAELGLYACHTNRFFDFSSGRWRSPNNACSVLSVHDLGQSGAQDAQYFTDESWHVFDLGLLPGSEWMDRWERAHAAGTRGPELGMRAVGWPKMDHMHSERDGFAAAVRKLREELGVGDKPVLLLACSWSDRQQLRDAAAHVDPDEFDVVVKYPPSSPPEAGSPWEERLREAYEELQRARELARSTSSVIVADEDADIMALLAVADVVLSNGSNVVYEGILAGTPGVSIRQWLHPAGRHGESTIQPHLELPGVLSGDLASLRTMLQVVRDPAWSRLVAESADAMVDPASRGAAATLAADAIEEALRWSDGLSREERGRLDEERDSHVVGGADMVAAVRQLNVYEEQVQALHRALQEADEREVRAREQLEAYERELRERVAALEAEVARCTKTAAEGWNQYSMLRNRKAVRAALAVTSVRDRLLRRRHAAGPSPSPD